MPVPAARPGIRWEWLRARSVQALVLLSLALHVGRVVPETLAVTRAKYDVYTYYLAALRVRSGEPLYRPWPEYGPHVNTAGGPGYPLDRFPYPPPLAVLLAPAAALPGAVFIRAWGVLLLAATWGYAACLARLAARRWTLPGTLLAAAVLQLTPGTRIVLAYGNVEPLLWLAFGLALVFPAARGPGFTFAAAVKTFGIWPLLLAFREEGPRAVRGAALIAGGLALLGSIVMGPAAFVGACADWFRYMLPAASQGSFAISKGLGFGNLSLGMAGLRIAGALGWEYVAGPLPAGARLYLALVSVAAPLAAIRWTRRLRDAPLRYALVTCAAMVFAPIFWTTYLPVLLAPAALCLRLPERSREAAPQAAPR